jgi:hypothetical protein
MSRNRIPRSRTHLSRARLRSRRHQHSRPASNSCPYERREALLSRGELIFFRVLCRAIAPWHAISIKTRLADVVRCRPELWDTSHGRRLSQKHVDFVVYDRFTAAIVAVVELDDRSHNAPARRDRDSFVDGILRSVEVAIVRIRAASSYNIESLRRQLDV